jgi:hypothetical protein
MALLAAMVTIVFGVLVLAFPGFLRWIIGAYLILSGILMLV